MRDGLIHPQLVARANVAPQRGSSGSIDQANDGIAVDCCRSSLAKLEIAKPRLFARNFAHLPGIDVIQVEYEKVVFQAGSEIGKLPSAARLFFCQQRIIFRTEAADHVSLSGLEPHDLLVLAADKQKDEFIEIRQALVVAIRLPIVRITLQHDALSRYVLLK